METAALDELILELLANAPSSFASLYGYLTRQDLGRRLRVAEILGILTSLEERGWVRCWRVETDGRQSVLSTVERASAERQYRAWLERATDVSVDALSVDEVGLWWELLPHGRIACDRLAKAREAGWTLDYDSHARTIRIHAQDPVIAEEALDQWSRLNPEIDLLRESRAIMPAPAFRLRDGRIISDGVLLKVQCQEKVEPPRVS